MNLKKVVSVLSVSFCCGVAPVTHAHVAPLSADTPYLIKMDTTVGTLSAGKYYIYYHNTTDTAAKDTLLDFRTVVKESSTLNTEFNSGVLRLWGARFVNDSAHQCLTYQGTCAAHIVGTDDLFSSAQNSTFKSKFEAYTAGVIAELDTAISAVTASPSYGNIRNLAEQIRAVSLVYPVTYKVQNRAALGAKLREAADTLMALDKQNDILLSTYCDIRPYVYDQITAPLVIESLATWRKIGQAEAVDANAYITSFIPILRNTDMTCNAVGMSYFSFIDKKVTDAQYTQNSLPNDYALYLSIAPTLKALGEPFRPEMQTGIQQILNWQTTSDTRMTCSNAGIPQVYGGWAHNAQGAINGTDNNCEQKGGYHFFIVRGLAAIHEYLLSQQTIGCSSTQWVGTCAGLRNGLMSSVAWTTNIQHDDTNLVLHYRIADIAPTTIVVGQLGAGSANYTEGAGGSRIGLGSAYYSLALLRQFDLNNDATRIRFNYPALGAPADSILVFEQALYNAFTKETNAGRMQFMAPFLRHQIERLIDRDI